MPCYGGELKMRSDQCLVESFLNCFRAVTEVPSDEVKGPGSFSSNILRLLFPFQIFYV